MTRQALTLALVCTSAAWARSGGLAVTSCVGCHAKGDATTSLTLTPSVIAPGATVSIRVTIRGALKTGGFSLSTSNNRGTFALVSGQGTRLSNDAVVHSTPKNASNGVVTFDVLWTAPSTPGGTVFEAASVMANGDRASGGDAASDTSVVAVWGCSGTTFWADFDGDGIGATSSGSVLDCSPPAGYSATNTDCDDNDAEVAPNKSERCNQKDDNCNGQIDDGLANVMTWPDVDSDGFGDAKGTSQLGCAGNRRATNALDCNDSEASIHPGATEVCNLRDDDCDSAIDDGAQLRCGTGWCARYGPTCNASDCRPGDPVAEKCNAFDDDCDGVIDNGDLCGTDLVCSAGRCIVGVYDAGIGGAAPGGEQPCACGAVSAGLSLTALALWSLMRRRHLQA